MNSSFQFGLLLTLLQHAPPPQEVHTTHTPPQIWINLPASSRGGPALSSILHLLIECSRVVTLKGM